MVNWARLGIKFCKLWELNLGCCVAIKIYTGQVMDERSNRKANESVIMEIVQSVQD
jgi:hypothetical protein